MDNAQLCHWGIKGQKWGIRRFQNKDGSLTPVGRKRYADAPTDPEAAKKAHEEARQKAIKSGSATEVMKFRGEYTQQEMDSIANRIRWEQSMSEISSREIAAGKMTVKKVFGAVDDVTGYVNTAAKAWNTVANIYNAFGNNAVSLPKIDTEITKSNRDKRKQEKADEEARKKKAAKQEAEKKEAEKKKAEWEAKQKSEEKSKQKTKDKVYEGEVFGEGTSKRKTSDNAGSSKQNKTYDATDYTVYEDTPVSSVPAEVRSRGKSFVSGLLGMGEKED